MPFLRTLHTLVPQAPGACVGLGGSRCSTGPSWVLVAGLVAKHLSPAVPWHRGGPTWPRMCP